MEQKDAQITKATETGQSVSRANREVKEVHITEVTLSELSRAVKEAKEKGATQVEVSTSFSNIAFVVDVSAESNMMESLGYRASSFTMPVSDKPGDADEEQQDA